MCMRRRGRTARDKRHQYILCSQAADGVQQVSRATGVSLRLNSLGARSLCCLAPPRGRVHSLGVWASRSKLGSSSTRLRDGPGNELTPADAHTRRGCTGAGLVAGGTAWQVQHVGGRAIPGWLNAGFSQHRLPELQVQVREVPAQVPKPGSGQWQRSPEHHRAVLQACQVRYAQRLQPSQTHAHTIGSTERATFCRVRARLDTP